METKGKQNEKQNKSTFKCKKQGKGSVGGRGEGNTGKNTEKVLTCKYAHHHDQHLLMGQQLTGQ